MTLTLTDRLADEAHRGLTVWKADESWLAVQDNALMHLTRWPGLLGAAVVEWLDRRREQMTAAVQTAYEHQWWDTTAQLVDALWPLFLRRRQRVLWIRLLQAYGLPAAELGLARPGLAEEETRRGRRMVRRMLATLGGGLRSALSFDAALVRYQQALDSARADGHRREQAQALDGIGAVHQQAGRPDHAVPALLEALQIRQDIGHTRGQALTQIRLGEIAADQHQWEQALDHLTRARAALLELEDDYDAARALAILGRTQVRAGDTAAGQQQLQQAEQVFTSTGSHHWRARCREWLGETAEAASLTDTYLLAAALSADALITPRHHANLPTPFTSIDLPDVSVFAGKDQKAMLDWLQRRSQDLESAVRAASYSNWHDLAIRLPDAMWALLCQQRDLVLWSTVFGAHGLPAARAETDQDDLTGEERAAAHAMLRRMLTAYAVGLRESGVVEAALLCDQEALDDARGFGHRRDEAQSAQRDGQQLPARRPLRRSPRLADIGSADP